MNDCKVGEDVDGRVEGRVSVEVLVGGMVGVFVEGFATLVFPSARDSERPPKMRATEARAIKMP
jgi:hypothetical protein